jgi:hypothetical protein
VQFPCKYLAKGYPVAYEEVFLRNKEMSQSLYPKISE